jgi:guanyl-specific ribonuclease Sa
MNKKKRSPLLLLAILLLIALLLGGCGQNATAPATPKAPMANTQSIQQTAAPEENKEEQAIQEDGYYTTKEDVAAYLVRFGKLPPNFITKKEAQALGWPGGDLRPYAQNRCIGGDRFYNYEGLLPKKTGRIYYDCDIDTLDASSRGPKRIVHSNDGLIYYTPDHYESFELLEGTP